MDTTEVRVPDSLVFAKAVHTIETKGWHRPGNHGGLCIWTAIYRSLEDVMDRDEWPLDWFEHFEKIVVKHFGVISLTEVFRLNDRQPSNTGKQWAIMHLSAMRDTAIREEEAQEPSFFSRLWDMLTGRW